MSGLSLSNPSSTLNSKLLVTKANAAGQTKVGSDVVVTGVGSGSSAWGQVTSSLSADTAITNVAVETSTAMSTIQSTTVDVGIGGAGSEVVVATIPLDLLYQGGTTARMGKGTLTIPNRIASGQRVAVRITDPGNNIGSASVTIRIFGATYANLEGN